MYRISSIIRAFQGDVSPLASRLFKTIRPGGPARLALLPAIALAFLAPHPCLAGADAKKDRLPIPIIKAADGSAEGWQLKEWSGKARYEVIETEAGGTLHLSSSATSTALYKEARFNIRDLPTLNWKWKATKLPAGGDVRKKSADDQAAQVYVIFPRWPEAVNSRLVGYIWDTTAPVGSIVTSTKTSNVRYIVVRSGEADLGRWLSEQRNVYADYKKLFNEEPPEAGRVSVMIDSDNTKSAAESFVAEIYFSK